VIITVVLTFFTNKILEKVWNRIRNSYRSHLKKEEKGVGF